MFKQVFRHLAAKTRGLGEQRLGMQGFPDWTRFDIFAV